VTIENFEITTYIVQIKHWKGYQFIL